MKIKQNRTNHIFEK